MFLALELCLSAICLATAYMRPQTADRLFGRIEKVCSAFAQKRILALVTIGLLGLGIRVALLPILPIPQPEVHDEYSYLLLADTLAHGRLANPPHPQWVHFETFHVNWHPTYASMYYPGYALFLAFGQVALGHPFWGVVLSSALMCAAISWALQGWLSPGWAFLGGVLAIVRLGSFSYWADSYWGGTVVALGGALVIGALPRIQSESSSRVRNSILLGIGMGILASTRPYEGIFLCLPLITVLAWWMFRTPLSRKVCLTEVVLPFSFVIIASLCGLAYYFWRVTGSPFTIPYQLNMRTYGLIFFPWEKVKSVEFHHLALQQYYRGAGVLGFYRLAREHPFKLQSLKALVIWLFYFGPVLTLPWIVWLLTRPRKQFWSALKPPFRLLFLLLLAGYIPITLTIHLGQPHYAAHLTTVFYLITLFLIHDLYGGSNDGVSRTRFVARSIPVICLVLFATRAAAPLLHADPKPSWIRTWCSRDAENLERAKILKQLESKSGEHLVIVRYKTNHDFILDEWVFNNADIDGSQVVWARDMGAQNAELIRYFAQRHVWLAEPDYNPPRLSPYVD